MSANMVTEQLALTEAAYCTVRLVQRFSGVESRVSGDWIENLTITCCPQESEMVFKTWLLPTLSSSLPSVERHP